MESNPKSMTNLGLLQLALEIGNMWLEIYNYYIVKCWLPWYCNCRKYCGHDNSKIPIDSFGMRDPWQQLQTKSGFVWK